MFATRQAAVDAQKSLHEKKTLPGVSVWRGLGEQRVWRVVR